MENDIKIDMSIFEEGPEAAPSVTPQATPEATSTSVGGEPSAQPKQSLSIDMSIFDEVEPAASQVADMASTEDMPSVWERITTDVKEAAPNLHKHLANGIGDALNESAELLTEIGNAPREIASKLFGSSPPQGFLTFNREEGFVWSDSVQADSPVLWVENADVGEDDSTTGQMVNDVSQFVTGLVTGGKLLKGLGVGAGAVRNIGAASFSEGVSFAKEEETLLEFANKYPQLDKVIPDFLAADEDNTKIETTLKRSITGLGLGVIGEAFLSSVRALRAAKRGKPVPDISDEIEGTIKADTEIKNLPATVEKSTSPEAAGATKAGEAGQSSKVADDGAEEASEAFVNVTEAQHAELLEKIHKTIEDPREGIDSDIFKFDKLTTEDAYKDGINQVADVFKENIDEATGGVRTHKETIANAAKRYNMSTDEFMEAQRKIHGDVADLDAKVNAGETMMQSLAMEVNKLAQVMDSGSVTRDMEATLIRRLDQFTEMTALQKGVQTNVARALSAMRINTGAKLIDVDALDKLRASKAFKDTVRKVKEANGDLGKTAKALEKSKVRKLMDLHAYLFKSSILSGPTTLAVNIVSTAGYTGVVKHFVTTQLSGLVQFSHC